MDLDEWVLLSDEGFIDHHEDDCVHPESQPNTATVIDLNYFQKTGNSRVIPEFDEILAEEVTKLSIESSQLYHENQIKDQNFAVLKPKSDDQEMISNVSLKETNEFVDMKKDPAKCLNRGFRNQIDVGTRQFDEKEQNFDKKTHEDDERSLVSEEMKSLKSAKRKNVCKWDDDGLKVWKWAMTGMGALISFGFAAAAVSFIVFSNRHKQTTTSTKKELQSQIYSHDKRFKQVVRRAKKLNEAISVMRGAPITRAHITTIGGFYEEL